jgi:transmembrane sensor
MKADYNALRNLVAQQGADWFVTNREELAGREREEFAAWLRTSPVHIEEYLAIAAMSQDLREACADWADSVDTLVSQARDTEDPQTELWPGAAKRRARRGFSFPWRAVAASLAGVGLLALGLFTLRETKSTSESLTVDDAMTLRFVTVHGEQLTRSLPDGSVLHLNTDSAATVRYSKSERAIILTSGEADFEVAHEHDRPFRVFAGAAEAIDLGTQFDVRLERGSTVVTVLEGSVAVGRVAMPHEAAGANGPIQFVGLTANQQIRVAQGAWPALPVQVDAQRTGSWMRRQISFEQEPLAQVASELNRYTSKPIVIDTPGLRDLQISGVLATDDIDAFVAFLRSLDGVHVNVTATRIRVTRD